MAKAFAQLKNPALAPTDQIPLGKLKGCRVCDVVSTEYDYLIWLDRNKYVTYTEDSIKLIKKHAGYAEAVRHYEEEVAPYLEDVPDFDDPKPELF